MKIQVFEHQKLKYTENPNFSQSQFEALVKFQEKHSQKYFEVISKGVKFKQYVGVLQVGKLTIEILPKADKYSFEQSDTQKWQHILLKMLKVCKKMKLESSAKALLKSSHTTLLDIYINIFLSEIKQILRKGLVKQYQQQEQNLRTLKGNLLFAKHLQKNIVHKERFYTRQEVYDKENLWNQILRKALEVLPLLISNPKLKQKVEEIMILFPEMSCNFSIQQQTFDKIKFKPKTQHYKTALKIAEMILLNFSPDVQGGKENILALLFDMNALFEEYIFRILQKTVSEDIWQIERQQTKTFWENQVIKPDIVLKNLETHQTFVLDTKWKILEKTKPSDADLKQLYVYHHYFEADKTFLLYPKIFQEQDFYQGFFRTNTQHENLECSLIFVEDLLAKDLGKNVLEKLIWTSSFSNFA